MISKSQLKANKKWKINHKKQTRYISYRGTAKTFINKYANDNDLKLLLQTICSKLGINANSLGQSSKINDIYKNQHYIAKRNDTRNMAIENAINKLASLVVKSNNNQANNLDKPTKRPIPVHTYNKQVKPKHKTINSKYKALEDKCIKRVESIQNNQHLKPKQKDAMIHKYVKQMKPKLDAIK